MCYARLAGASCRSIAVGYPSSDYSPTARARCCLTSRSQAQVHAACTCRTPKETSLMGLVGGSTRSSQGTARETCRYYAACRLRQRFAHPNRLRRDRAGTMPDRTPGRSKGKYSGISAMFWTTQATRTPYLFDTSNLESTRYDRRVDLLVPILL